MGSFVIDILAMTFGMPRALFPALSLTVYHAGAAGVGLLYAAVSAGAVVAAFTTGWLGTARRLGRIVVFAVLVWGLGIVFLGLTSSLWVAMAALAIAGAADSVSAVCRSTILQTATPDSMRGRMSSIFMLVVAGGPRTGRRRVGRRRGGGRHAGVGGLRRSAVHARGGAGRACLPRVLALRGAPGGVRAPGPDPVDQVTPTAAS